MLIPIAFAEKDVISMEFDREDVAFAVRNLLCTVQTKGNMRCATLVRHLAGGLGLVATRTNSFVRCAIKSAGFCSKYGVVYFVHN